MAVVKAKVETNVQKLLREVKGFAWLVATACLIFILWTYHPGDPCLFLQSSHGREVLNAFGIVGATLSGWIMAGIGFSAFIIPLITLAMGVGLIRAKRELPIPNRRAGFGKGLRIAGLVLLFITTATLLALILGSPEIRGGQVQAGGLLGRWLASLLKELFSAVGAFFLAGILFFAGLMLTFNFSPVHTIEAVQSIYDAISDFAGRIYTMWRERRLRRVEVQKEKTKLEQARLESKIKEPIITAPKAPDKPKKQEKPVEEPKALQESFEFMKLADDFTLPGLDLLDEVDQQVLKIDKDNLLMNARLLEKKLSDFGIQGAVAEVQPGPVITMYEYRPAAGIKINRIANLADDLALALSALSVRIIAPIPGKDVVGIEIPNKERQTVYLREILTSDEFAKMRTPLPLALGKNTIGAPSVFDLKRAPHLLVAGATGSGKSVSLNAMIMSVIYRSTPDQVRMLMIDPKRLELSVYEGIPHLLHNVICDPKEASFALRWAVGEMERRYAQLAEKGVRNIDSYNRVVEKEIKNWKKPKPRKKTAEEKGDTLVIDPATGERRPKGETTDPIAPPEPLPVILVVIDELADLMMVAARDCEESICRLAQMARAAGIHLILATQRPSVDVITGLIKANFPTRISFQVSSKTDSRTILDANGAERLLGMGDMLYLGSGTSKLERIHGAFVSDREIQRVVHFLGKQGRPVYDVNIIKPSADEHLNQEDDRVDEKYDEAVAIVTQTRQASISMLQRRLRVGYNRAARMIERMEAEGLVGPSDGVRPREVLIDQIDLQK